MIINPITQRKIKIDGKTFKDLIVVRGYTMECLLNLPFFDSDKTIPIELWQEILYQSDINLLKSILCTNKQIYSIGQNKLFWNNKFNINRLPISNLNLKSYIYINNTASEVDDILKIIRLYPINSVLIYSGLGLILILKYENDIFTLNNIIIDVKTLRYFLIEKIIRSDQFINISVFFRGYGDVNLRLYHLKKSSKSCQFSKQCLSLLKI
jgi:hypothetical protein